MDIIYCLNQKQLNGTIMNRLLKLIPEDSKRKTRAYINWRDQQAHVFGRMLLKKLFIVNSPDLQIQELKYNVNGKPYISDSLHFNISHSGDYVVCGYSHESIVGIDVEKIDKKCEIGLLIEKLFPKEANHINTADDPYAMFYKYWTVKEAAVKADGRGLAVSFRDIDIGDNTVSIGGRNFYYLSETFYENYQLSVVSERPFTRPMRIYKTEVIDEFVPE